MIMTPVVLCLVVASAFSLAVPAPSPSSACGETTAEACTREAVDGFFTADVASNDAVRCGERVADAVEPPAQARVRVSRVRGRGGAGVHACSRHPVATRRLRARIGGRVHLRARAPRHGTRGDRDRAAAAERDARA
jgi:hypothetical protein